MTHRHYYDLFLYELDDFFLFLYIKCNTQGMATRISTALVQYLDGYPQFSSHSSMREAVCFKT